MPDVSEFAADDAAEDTAKAYQCPGVGLKLLAAVLRIEPCLAYHETIDYHIHESSRQRNKRTHRANRDGVSERQVRDANRANALNETHQDYVAAFARFKYGESVC